MAETHARFHHLHPVVQEPVPFYVVGTTPTLKREVEHISRHSSALRYIHSDVLTPLTESQQHDLFAEADVILVEWHPDLMGTMCQLRRSAVTEQVPLLAICGTDETDHVAALVIGADDVIQRPLNPLVVRAKLRAYQRQQHVHPRKAVVAPTMPKPTGESMVCVGPLLIDGRTRTFYIHDESTELTRIEFDLMLYMMQRAGECQTRDEILDAVWDMAFAPNTNILDVHMCSLRGKLKPHGLGDMVQTVRGVGYQLSEVDEA